MILNENIPAEWSGRLPRGPQRIQSRGGLKVGEVTSLKSSCAPTLSSVRRSAASPTLVTRPWDTTSRPTAVAAGIPTRRNRSGGDTHSPGPCRSRRPDCCRCRSREAACSELLDARWSTQLLPNRREKLANGLVGSDSAAPRGPNHSDECSSGSSNPSPPRGSCGDTASRDVVARTVTSHVVPARRRRPERASQRGVREVAGERQEPGERSQHPLVSGKVAGRIARYLEVYDSRLGSSNKDCPGARAPASSLCDSSSWAEKVVEVGRLRAAATRSSRSGRSRAGGDASADARASGVGRGHVERRRADAIGRSGDAAGPRGAAAASWYFQDRVRAVQLELMQRAIGAAGSGEGVGGDA